MPTCGFIRVQPDGMKIKDEGNRQRYDPVSKRMITIYPETPPVLDLTLLSISQPTFVDSLFLSDYTVSFRRYSGCLSYGNDVRISIYNSAGTQVATTVATLASGVNTLVLRGEYTPEVSVYYASATYRLTAFNSKPTELFPELPIISNVAAGISSLNFYQQVGSVGWSHDNSFYWTGSLNINFVSYDRSNSPASYSVDNITDPSNEYTVVSDTSFNLSYGRNTITLPPTTIITIPSGSGRTSLPYNPTERFLVTITHSGDIYRAPTVSVSPALIQNVVLAFTDSYWVGNDINTAFRISYRLADGTQYSSLDISTGLYESPFIGYQNIVLYESSSDGSSRYIFEAFLEGQSGNVDATREYTGTGVLQGDTREKSYYATVEYARPSFAIGESATVRSPAISSLIPELASSPGLSFSNFRIESGRFVADFTLTFNYQPRNTPQTSLQITLTGTSPIDRRTVNVAVGSNTIQLTTIPVAPGTSYTVSIPTGSVVSTSVPVFVPTYDLFRFTSVPTYVETLDGITLNPVAFFSIAISWNNTIPGYSGGQIAIGTVGLTDGAYGTIDSSITYTPGSSGIATVTFDMYPVATPTGNAIEQTLAKWVYQVAGFPYFRFRITDTETGASILSSRIGSGVSDHF